LMDLEINDYIILLVRTKEDTFNTIDVEIGGIVRTPNPMVNTGTVFVPLKLAQDRLNAENSLTMLSVKISSGQGASVIKNLEATLLKKDSPLKAYSWQESAENVINYSKIEKQAIGAIMSIVLLIGMVGIINNIILSSLERKSEIGMMKALGMREWEIVFVFMIEATGIGILGGLAGCLMGYFGVSWLVNNGLNFTAIYGDWIDWAEYGVPILDTIYGVWNYSTFSYVFFLGIFVAILSSIFPAYWAAHKNPVESIYRR